MTFTSPALLWALPLAAAPLLVHLLSRRSARKVPFSDLAFLRLVHARSLPRTRLRQWLLVLARCGILLALVLACAGPVLQASGGAGASAGGALDLVLWLDASYSMGARERGKTRFELARRGAEDLIRALKPADRVAIGVFSDRDETPGGKLEWTAPRQAFEVLARAKLGFRVTDYRVPLKASSDFLRGVSGRRRAVVVLTDGARHGFRGLQPTLDPDILWLGLSWPEAEPNAAVLEAKPSRESSADRPRLSARVADLSGGARPRSLDVWLGGLRVLGAALKGGPGEEGLTVDLPPSRDQASPSWAGSAALRPDALSADDAWFFSFRHPKRPRVLCLYGNPGFFRAPSGGYFLKELFGGAKESLLDYDADFLELPRWKEARLSEYRIVILADFKEVPPPAATALDAFVRGGGGLWVLPGARGSADAFAPLNSWLPAQVGPLVSGEGYGVKPSAAGAKDWREFDLGALAIGRYHLLQTRPGSTVWLRSASGYPLLVSGPRGDGRVAVWASALDLAWSNLALKPAFVSWAQTSLGLLAAAERRAESFEVKVGEPLVRVWEPREAAPASVRLRGPEGGSAAVWVKERRVEFPLTARPGLYTLAEDGSGQRRVYAVNLDRSTGESDLATEPHPPWRRLDSEDLPRGFELAVYGQDARDWALAASAAFLALEMILALPRVLLAAVLVLGLGALPSRAQQGDRFVWTQLKLGSAWDPYPAAAPEALALLSSVTSVLASPERRVLTLKDKALYSSPLVVLAGRQAPPDLDDEDIKRLRNYLAAGGLLWIEDVSGTVSSGFDRWARRVLTAVLPETELSALPPDHVVFKTFFLLRGTAGRVMVRGNLEGVNWGGRTAVIYSRNDLLGAWVKDALGKPLYPCVPGGEAQRHNARKLTLNIIMYALTGNYKSDAVHQPYLLQKMRSGVP